jgi:hypothetical protein
VRPLEGGEGIYFLCNLQVGACENRVEGWWVMLVTMLGQSREHEYWLKYQCRDIISWIGGGPRSAIGIAMEEEGVVVEVACCVYVCLSVSGVFILLYLQVGISTYISNRSYI